MGFRRSLSRSGLQRALAAANKVFQRPVQPMSLCRSVGGAVSVEASRWGSSDPLPTPRRGAAVTSPQSRRA
eukprot:1250425-Prymnesium_polylepis.1